MLTSRSNPKMKFVEALRKSRERKKQGLYVVEGEREIARAKDIVTVYYFEKTDLIIACEKNGIELVQISKKLLEKISLRGEPVGVGKIHKKSLLQIKGKLFIALVGVEKPGNIGAILRSCDGAGVDGVLIVDPVVDHYHPNAIRASLGASFSLDIACCSTQEAFDFIKSSGVKLVTTSPDAKKSYSQVDLTGPTMIVFGQEDEGLPQTWMKGEEVYIPMKGICDSLNVSVSVGILLYEAVRQNEC